MKLNNAQKECVMTLLNSFIETESKWAFDNGDERFLCLCFDKIF